MAIVHRPNKDAIVKACDIYRDAMRPFLVRVLRRVKGQNLLMAIKNSLPDDQRRLFETNLSRNNNNVAAAIDIGMFPHLISANWREVFFDEFRGDNSVRDLGWLIRDVRNKVAHPGTADLEDEYTRSRLFDIADVLGRINAPEEKSAVESIRDSRWGRAPIHQSIPPASFRDAVSSPGRITPRRSSSHSVQRGADGTMRQSVETGALEQYVIYVDDPTNRSRIHKIDCRWYINRKEERLSDNYWLHGPYTLEKATDTEQDVGKKNNGFCGHCIR